MSSSRTLPTAALALALLWTHAIATADTPLPRLKALRAGSLVDVRTGQVVRNPVVLIDGERIRAVGSGLPIPDGAELIDPPGLTLLPGFIDAHTHITNNPEDSGYSYIAISVPRETTYGVRNARITLEAGFTTIRNLGASGYSDIALRDAINAGDVPGPRIVASGPALGITGGHCDDTAHGPQFHVVSEGVADGIAGVMQKTREVIKYGADVIKICATGGVLSFGDDPQASQYTLEEMKTIVGEAHRLGRKVAAHAHGREGIRLATLAGVDSIEHGSYIDDENIKLMKERGTYLVPTVFLGDWLISHAEQIKLPAAMLKKAKDVLPQARLNIARAFKAGVLVALGTDAAVYPHGLNAGEFSVYVELGMTPLQALQAGTINAARLLGLAGDVGAIEAGKYADIVAVAGDPLKDISETQRVKFVIKGGAVVKR